MRKIKVFISFLAFFALIALFVVPTLTLAPTSGRNQSVATRGMPPVPSAPPSSLQEETQIAQTPEKISQPEERARALFDIQIQALIQESPVLPMIMIIAGILAWILGCTLYVWKIRTYFYHMFKH